MTQLRALFRTVLRGLVALLLGIATAAGAAKLEVSPVTHDLPPGKTMLSMTVTNRGDASVTVQLRGFTWTQEDGQERLTPADGVIFSPPIFGLEPGRSQVVRARMPERPAATQGPAPGPAGREATYRLLIDEIPSATAEPGEPLRFALRLSIPVFCAAPAEPRAELAWHVDAASRTLVAANDGGRRERVRDIVLAGADGQPLATIGPTVSYLLAGARRSWPLPANAPGLAPGQALVLTAQTDAGRIEVPLVVSP